MWFFLHITHVILFTCDSCDSFYIQLLWFFSCGHTWLNAHRIQLSVFKKNLIHLCSHVQFTHESIRFYRWFISVHVIFTWFPHVMFTWVTYLKKRVVFFRRHIYFDRFFFFFPCDCLFGQMVHFCSRVLVFTHDSFSDFYFFFLVAWLIYTHLSYGYYMIRLRLTTRFIYVILFTRVITNTILQFFFFFSPFAILAHVQHAVSFFMQG